MVQIKKPKRKLSTSQRMRKQIADWEGDHFAQQNDLYNGDAIGAHEAILNNLLNGDFSHIDQNTYDAMSSYVYNTRLDTARQMAEAWNRYRYNPTDDNYNSFVQSFNAGYNNDKHSGLRVRRDFERSLLTPIPEDQKNYPVYYPTLLDTNYDQARAQQLGYARGDNGHYASRDQRTGDILKYPSHPTFGMALYKELGSGYLPVKRKKGKFKANTQPTPMRQWMDRTFNKPILGPLINEEE